MRLLNLIKSRNRLLKNIHYVKFTAVTPLWTGDAFRNSEGNSLETGVIGSLRWWTEVLVRGMGIPVQDPTTGASGQTSEDPTHLETIFGQTDRQRRFRLTLEGGKEFAFPTTRTSGRYVFELPIVNSRGTKPSWQFPSKARAGQMELRTLDLHPDRPGPAPETLVSLLLNVVSKVGGLGARTQHGCGIIQTEPSRDPEQLFKWLSPLWIKGQGRRVNPELPSLRNCFVGEFRAKGERNLYNWLDTFWARYHLRGAFRPDPDSPAAKDLRHFLFGTLRPEHIGSKINVSFPFNTNQDALRVRVWGWIPETANRSAHLKTIRAVMETHFNLEGWKDLVDWYASGSNPVDKLSNLLESGASPWNIP